MVPPCARKTARKVIDLFSGVGGFSLGAARAGFEVAAALDNDTRALDTHARNFPHATHLNVRVDASTQGSNILARSGLEQDELAAVIAGPPCQGFSLIGKRNPDDTRNELFVHAFRLIEELRPRFFVVENVPGILTKSFRGLRERAAKAANSYEVLEPLVLSARDCGAPTTRTRVYFVGQLRDFGGSLDQSLFLPPRTLVPPTVNKALCGLPEHVMQGSNGEVRLSSKLRSPRRFASRIYGVVPRGVGDPAALKLLREHDTVTGFVHTQHGPEVAERFANTAAGKTEPRSRFPRLDPDAYCPTLRAGTDESRGSFQAVRPIHPSAPRVITPREAARLQGFPDWFVFHSTKWHAFRQIGNSVSPIVAEHLLGVIHTALEGEASAREN